jgi:hypothetical protein
MEKNKLRTDKKFKWLKSPLSDTDYTVLEEDIFENGCKEPIVVWRGIIIDGNKRYEICHRWDIEYNIRTVYFQARCDAIHYICKLELKRTDIREEKRKYLLGKMFEAAYVMANRKSNPSRKYNDVTKRGVAKSIGETYELCRSTIEKYFNYAKAIDEILNYSSVLAQKILSGNLKIAYTTLLYIATLPSENIEYLYRYVCNNNKRNIEEREVKRLIDNYNFYKRKEIKMQSRILIKQEPEYDPDAEIQSLLLTIPSWISSMNRTKNMVDFKKISDGIRINIDVKLDEIIEAISEFRKELEEEL